jgi:chemotaxis protein CheC
MSPETLRPTNCLDPRSLHHFQLDALREVANIGAGHAATALSQMTNHRIMVSVPHLQVIPVQTVPELLSDPEEPVVAVMMHMLADLTGRAMLIFPRESALRVAEILLRRKAGSTSDLDVLAQSAISEAANILGSAYMNALASFMGMMLLPSVPTLLIDGCAAVLSAGHAGSGVTREWVFTVETEFLMQLAEQPVEGYFLLMPDPASLDKILRTIRLA